MGVRIPQEPAFLGLLIINGDRPRSLIGKTFLEELFYEIVLGLPDYESSDFGIRAGEIQITARYVGLRSCPHCGSQRLRNKGRYKRRIRHEDWGLRHCVLELEACKWKCR